MYPLSLKQQKQILYQFRHSGICLNDEVIVNVLYLMQSIQGTLSFATIDPLLHTTLAKRERTRDAVISTLYEEKNDIVFMPLVFRHHWSLLVFVQAFSGYIHFDSIRGFHTPYVKEVLAVVDPESRYQPLPIHTSQDSQQAYDWECGFFVLMNAFLFIHMKRDALQSEESMRLYLARHTPSVCERKIRRFTQKIYDIVLSI